MGGLELVGDIGNEIGLEHFGRAELLRHQVKALANVLNIANGAGLIQPNGKIAVGNPLHGGIHPANGLENPPVDRGGQAGANDQAGKQSRQDDGRFG